MEASSPKDDTGGLPQRSVHGGNGVGGDVGDPRARRSDVPVERISERLGVRALRDPSQLIARSTDVDDAVAL
jgi:hypothetical protein